MLEDSIRFHGSSARDRSQFYESENHNAVENGTVIVGIVWQLYLILPRLTGIGSLSVHKHFLHDRAFEFWLVL